MQKQVHFHVPTCKWVDSAEASACVPEFALKPTLQLGEELCWDPWVPRTEILLASQSHVWQPRGTCAIAHVQSTGPPTRPRPPVGPRERQCGKSRVLGHGRDIHKQNLGKWHKGDRYLDVDTIRYRPQLKVVSTLSIWMYSVSHRRRARARLYL